MLKHIFTFLFILLFLSSCKKDFATFQNGSTYVDNNVKNLKPIEKLNNLTNTSYEASVINSESIITKNSEYIDVDQIGIEIAKIETSPEEIVKNEHNFKTDYSKKTSIFHKPILKKVNKTNDATEENTSKVDVIALLSTIFGGLGMLLMFSGIGWLFGLAGLILGAIGLKKKTKNRTLAILGVVLGSISTLVGLLFVIIIAAFISANI